MEENKRYYTPTIDEFHVGFEYEVMIPEKHIWSKEVFYLNESHIKLIEFVNIQNEFTKNKIRVKCLDREDIESLGLKIVRKSETDTSYYLCKADSNLSEEVYLHYNITGGVFRLEVTTNGGKIGSKEGIGIPLKVKNKSELKILLQQM